MPIRIKYLAILAILLFPICTFAASPTYYVSPNGVATWANCEDSAGTPGPKSGTSACPYTEANDHATAGDVVKYRGGTYNVSGALTNAIALTGNGTSAEAKITLQAYTGETPLFVNTDGPAVDVRGVVLWGKQWIKIEGISFQDFFRWAIIASGSSYNEISSCKFFNTSLASASLGVYIYRAGGDPSTHNWIHDNELYHNSDPDTGCSEGGDIIRIGANDVGEQDSNYNTIENNTIYHAGHTLTDSFSQYNVWRNNVGHNEGWKSNPGGCSYDPSEEGDYPGNGKYGHRGFSLYSRGVDTSRYNLFEGNRSGYASTNPNNNGADGLTLSAQGNIIRYNAFFGGDGPGIYFKNADASSNNRVYNNTIYKNGRYTGAGDLVKTGIEITKDSVSNVIKNNLLYDTGTADVTCQGTGCSMGANTWTNNWCDTVGCGSIGSGDPTFVNPSLADMTSLTLPNLALSSTSTAINAGTYLTQVNDADGCDADTAVCTDMVVDDALYFQDGTWGSSLSTIAPDEICISASADATDLARCRAISSINYATNTITLASEITFANNEYVWLYKKSDGTQVLIGTKPDIGAHEYNSGSVYTLTVSKAGSGTGTVSSDVTGIDCGATCEYDYDGTVVTLTATATLPNYFVGWSGEGCSGTSTCQVTMSAAKSVTATFSRYGVGTIGAGGQITFGTGGSITLQ